MARIELPAFIKTMSGTISKRELQDGRILRMVVTKKNRLYVRTEQPRCIKATEKELAQRSKFGLINRAIAIVRKELGIPYNPQSTKKLWEDMGRIYDRLREKGKNPTVELLAGVYSYEEY